MKTHWINGEWVESASREAFPVINPATEEVVDHVARGHGADVDRAVEAAFAAQRDWKFVPGIEKAERMHEFARRLRDKKEEIAILLTREGGKPLIENRDEVEWVAACFDYYAEMGRNEIGRVIASVQRHQINLVIKEPDG